MRVNFKKLLSIALTAVCILSSANVGTLAAPKAGSVKQVKAWGGKKTYIEPPSFSGSDKKVPKTAQGVFSGDIVLDFGGDWTYKEGEKGSDKDQTFRLKKDYFPKLTITKIYNNQSIVLTKDNKKQNGYEEDHTKGGNYIRLWGCFKDVTNDNKVVQFKFHDGTGTFQDIITTIQKKGDSRYQLLSVEYQDPDGNAGGETGEQFTISFDYDGKHENPESQTVSKGGKVRDPELADVAYWYVKGYPNWHWDFARQEVRVSYTLVAVLKKEIPVESEIWLCKPRRFEKTHVSVLYQYEAGKDYIQDLKESDKKKVIIRTDKEKPNMFFFSMQLKTGENKQRLNSKAYFSSEITIQRQDENNISIRDYKHLGKLCSVQFQNENGDLINSELSNFKIQEKNNLDTTLTAPIRYIRKGNKITLAPKLEEGYNWVKVENDKPTNQVFTIAQDIVDKNLVLRAVKKQNKKTFLVSFKSWDGKKDLVDSRAVEEGEKTQAPSVQGIVAWYTKDSSEAATEYNFSDSTITSALVLYGAKGYTITLEDSEGEELGKVKVSDAEPKIPADKLKDLNTEDIEYWYVKGKDPETTGNQIKLADYSATEDVTLIGKKKASVVEKEIPAIKSACIYPEAGTVKIEYLSDEYVKKIKKVLDTEDEDIFDTNMFSSEGNIVTISADFDDDDENEKILIYTIKAEGYKENQITVEKEEGSDPAFMRDEDDSTGMTGLFSVKFVKEDGRLVDDCIYYLPARKTLKDVGFTVPELPPGYEKWVDSNKTEFTEDTAVEQDLVLTAKKSEQNTYIEVTLMYQNQKETLNILKGNTIDSAVISEATKDWTDDVVGEKLRIASWQIKDGASFDITNTEITGAITLVAVPCQKWTVSFQVGGETVKIIKVYNEDTITLPEELKEKADKWYLENNEEFRFGTTKITADTTITGKKNVVAPEPQDPQPQEPQDPQPQEPQDPQPQEPSYTPDYTAPIFIEPIIESSTAGTATTRTTDNNSVTISDDSTPLSAGEMARIRAILDSYTEIRMKDIEAKGYNKLMKAYTKAVKKIKSRKVTDKEIAELYKKLQENKKKYVKMDCNIKRLNMAVIKGKNKKQLLALIKKLDKYVAAKYKETVFANLFKKYDKAIKALNDKNISDKKLDLVYKNLLTEKKNADRFLKKNK